MTEHLNDRSDPHKTVVVKDRVVRDDSNLVGMTIFGMLVAIVLAGGALVYALSGPHDTTASFNAPTPERSDGTVGQRAPAPNAK
jgi:hypothetical protein